MEKRPATVLERAIARGLKNDIDPSTVLWALAVDSAVILHDGEIPEGEFPPSPLIMNRGDQQFVALFTHEDFTTPFRADHVPVLVPVFEMLKRLPVEAGVVVNPGSRLGFEIPALGVRAFTQMLLETTIEA